MTDTELTPPILCERYGSYCSDWGTDYTIFRREPPNMGYYLRDQVFDPDVALAALEANEANIAYELIEKESIGILAGKDSQLAQLALG